jgi:hypothetical protein
MPKQHSLKVVIVLFLIVLLIGGGVAAWRLGVFDNSDEQVTTTETGTTETGTTETGTTETGTTETDLKNSGKITFDKLINQEKKFKLKAIIDDTLHYLVGSKFAQSSDGKVSDFLLQLADLTKESHATPVIFKLEKSEVNDAYKFVSNSLLDDHSTFHMLDKGEVKTKLYMAHVTYGRNYKIDISDDGAYMNLRSIISKPKETIYYVTKDASDVIELSDALNSYNFMIEFVD